MTIVLTTGCYHNTSSVVHSRSSPLSIPDTLMCLFFVRSAPWLLSTAPQGDLPAAHAGRQRRIISFPESLHLLYSMLKNLSRPFTSGHTVRQLGIIHPAWILNLLQQDCCEYSQFSRLLPCCSTVLLVKSIGFAIDLINIIYGSEQKSFSTIPQPHTR